MTAIADPHRIPHSLSHTPLAKLADCDPDSINVVLLACGSFSPVTYLHLRMFEQARDHLHSLNETRKSNNEKKFNVIGGFFSPVADSYEKPSLVASSHRLAMLRLATESSYWIGVSSWEQEQLEWLRTRPVLDSFSQLFEKNITSAPVRTMLVCGSDLLDSFLVPNLWAHSDIEILLQKYGIVALERDGFDIHDTLSKLPVLKDNAPGNLFSVKQEIQNTISSTAVRSAIKRHFSIKYLLPDPVMDYIEANRLFL